MRLICDLDIVLYRCLHATKEQGYYAGLRASDYTTDRILERFGYPIETYIVMSGVGNFRRQICSSYKANRKPESRPPYLYEVKQYFKKYWGAIESSGEEADDLIGQLITDDTVICSTDKDLKQFGVPIYNFVKDELLDITNPEFYYYLQHIVGDQADNIEGLKNPAKSHHANPPNFTEATGSKLLEGKSPQEMKEIVIDLYKQQYGDDWFSVFDTKSRLLFLRRKNAKEYYELYG